MHPMSGSAGPRGGGGADHGGQLYGDHQPPAAGFVPFGAHGDDDDVGSSIFLRSPVSGAGGDAAGEFTPPYSSLTGYLQGFLDPSGLARHLDAPTGDDAVTRGPVVGDATVSGAAAAAVATPNSSTSSDPRRGKEGRPAPEEGDEDEEGSADHQDCRGDARKKKKKGKVEKKARGSRVAFATKSEVDHLDDGYRWRKYGQKAVKNSSFPRSYYRCTAARCGVKKQVERSQQDPATVVTTYEGHHAHPSPAAHRGMPTGHYSLASLQQQQRHGFCPSSPDDILLAAAHAMAPPPAAAAASRAALLPRQAEHRLAEYYGMQLQDLLPNPLMGDPQGHR